MMLVEEFQHVGVFYIPEAHVMFLVLKRRPTLCFKIRMGYKSDSISDKLKKSQYTDILLWDRIKQIYLRFLIRLVYWNNNLLLSGAKSIIFIYNSVILHLLFKIINKLTKSDDLLRRDGLWKLTLVCEEISRKQGMFREMSFAYALWAVIANAPWKLGMIRT